MTNRWEMNMTDQVETLKQINKDLVIALAEIQNSLNEVLRGQSKHEGGLYTGSKIPKYVTYVTCEQKAKDALVKAYNASPENWPLKD